MAQALYSDLFRIIACEETNYGVVYRLKVDEVNTVPSQYGLVLPYAVPIKAENTATLTFAYSRMANLVMAVGVDVVFDTDDLIGEFVVASHDGTAIVALEPALIKRKKPAKPRKWWHWLIGWRS